MVYSQYVYVTPGEPYREGEDPGAEGGASPRHCRPDGAPDQTPRRQGEGSGRYTGDVAATT